MIDAAALLHMRDGGMPLLDVRSPVEYAHGHIPGALSLPLLSDEERARVGTAHARSGPEGAVHLALELMGPQLAAKLARARRLTAPHLAPRHREVLLHCWRGGQRSRAMSWLLETGGFTVHVLEGGYKAYRRHVRELLARPRRLVVLGGMTGCGKTDILQGMASLGCQVIDLEGLAGHRGSAFGGVGLGPQPTNEWVENRLAEQWAALDSARPVWVEDEDNHIGTVALCREFFQHMAAAPLVVAHLPVELRVARLVRMYADSDAGTGEAAAQALAQGFEHIRSRLGGELCGRCVAAVRAGDFATAARLSLPYYDKAYARQLEKRGRTVLHHLYMDSDDPVAAARELAALELWGVEHFANEISQTLGTGEARPAAKA